MVFRDVMKNRENKRLEPLVTNEFFKKLMKLTYTMKMRENKRLGQILNKIEVKNEGF